MADETHVNGISTAPRVVVFADFVCPYCYISQERVDQLIRDYDVQPLWRPYWLHPEVSPAGSSIPVDSDRRKATAEWLKEMAESNVAFRPLDASLEGRDIYNAVTGRPAKKDFFKRLADGAHLHHYRSVLSKMADKYDHLQSGKKLIALFSHATTDIAEKEIKL